MNNVVTQYSQIKRPLFERDDTYSLRGLCMLAIIAHHLYQRTMLFYNLSYPTPLNYFLQDAGYLGTAVFFLISGFGMTLSLWNKKPGFTDAIKRLSKLYLPFLFYWIVCFVLSLFDERSFSSHDLIGLISFDLIYMGGGKWFIISILLLYCHLIVLSQLLDTKKKAAMIMLITIGIYVIVSLAMFHCPPLWYNSILCFPLGVLCAAKKGDIQKCNNRKIMFMMLVVFCFSYVFVYFSASRYFPLPGVVFTPLFQIIAAIAFSLFAILLVSRINIRSRWLNVIGKYSFSVFLAHQVLVIFASRLSNVYIYTVAVLAGTCMLTWLYSKIDKLIFAH